MWQHEPCLLCIIILPRILGGLVSRSPSLIVMTRAPRISGVMFTFSVLVISALFSFTPAIVPGIRCCDDRLFGLDDYAVLKHGLLVSSLEQIVNSCGGIQRQRIKKLGIRTNNLLHCL